MWKLNLLFFIAIIVTTLLMRHEVRRYTDARLSGPVADFDRRRFTRRMIGVTILSIVLAMTYFGYTNREWMAQYPWFFALYWITTLLLVFSLIGLALLDVRAVFQQSMKKFNDDLGEAERLERFLGKDQEKLEQKVERKTS